jgi:homoserine kinase type II
MSVYTSVSHGQLSAWLKGYALGELQEFQGIAAGIENTNYFVTTTAGRFVLTLFEKLLPEELPFYLGLMTHLAGRGIPCPRPLPNLDGEVLGRLCDKPATLVTRLNGQDVEHPSAQQCALVGATLARLHLAGMDYPNTMPNPRGLAWWRGAALEVAPHMPAADAKRLEEELRFQSLYRLEDLPRGAIHADLFRDNVLFDGDTIGGVIDFYFACTEALLYDLAITVNDWCIDASGALDPQRTGALLAAYRAVRPVTAIERGAWPVVLRAGALRFWVSRLFDLHCPRPGELTFAKDPAHFQRILLHRIEAHSDAHRLLA